MNLGTMFFKIKIFLFALFGLLSVTALAYSNGCQISILVQHEKETYVVGDTITVLIKVKLDKAFCEKAGDATKVFSKGVKIEKRSEWKKLSNTEVGQKLLLTVLNKSKEKTLTVYRKTAHYNCFEQKAFKTRG